MLPTDNMTSHGKLTACWPDVTPSCGLPGKLAPTLAICDLAAFNFPGGGSRWVQPHSLCIAGWVYNPRVPKGFCSTETVVMAMARNPFNAEGQGFGDPPTFRAQWSGRTTRWPPAVSRPSRTPCGTPARDSWDPKRMSSDQLCLPG